MDSDYLIYVFDCCKVLLLVTFRYCFGRRSLHCLEIHFAIFVHSHWKLLLVSPTRRPHPLSRPLLYLRLLLCALLLFSFPFSLFFFVCFIFCLRFFPSSPIPLPWPPFHVEQSKGWLKSMQTTILSRFCILGPKQQPTFRKCLMEDNRKWLDVLPIYQFSTAPRTGYGWNGLTTM